MQQQDIKQSIIGWVESSDELEMEDGQVYRSRGRNTGPPAVEFNERQDRIYVHKDGGMALQGKFDGIDLDRKLSPGILYVRGTRHYWDDEGAQETEGRFAVFANDYLEIDGPVPEDD